MFGLCLSVYHVLAWWRPEEAVRSDGTGSTVVSHHEGAGSQSWGPGGKALNIESSLQHI